MDADSLERRAVQRSRVFLGGEVLIGRDFHPIECLIKNISECGAGGVANVVGNGCGALSGNMKLSFQAARSIG
jgi:hypothetical protein